jgi:Protein of unknown function (DUF3102)
VDDIDVDRNLIFERNLHRSRDDDGQSVSGLEAAENRAHRDGVIFDDGDAEQDGQSAKLDAAKARHAERGAQERKLLLGLATQEPGSAIVDAQGTVMQGVKWQSGQVVDRPWSEHPAVKHSIRRQNAFQAAEDRLLAATGASFEQVGYEPPAPGEPAFQAVKAVTTVAATSKRRHLSKADVELKSKLLKLSTGIRDAAAREDRAAAGALLREAKALLEHGEFVAWVERESGLSKSTVERYMREGN